MRIQDKLSTLKNKRGFTLVELMIVVAIIGVLAALAIYGVNKYMANAKSAEARTALGRIAKDSSSAWQRESMAGEALEPGGSAVNSRALCPAADHKVPDDLTKVANQKYQSSQAEWNDGKGWTCLKFTMDGPQYYMYNFQSTGVVGTAGVATDHFEAIANGDLDGDGTPSTFTLEGIIKDDSGELGLFVSPAIKEDAPEE